MLRRGAAKLVVLLTFLVGGALGARDGLTGLLAGYAGGARRHRPDGLGLRAGFTLPVGTSPVPFRVGTKSAQIQNSNLNSK